MKAGWVYFILAQSVVFMLCGFLALEFLTTHEAVAVNLLAAWAISMIFVGWRWFRNDNKT